MGQKDRDTHSDQMMEYARDLGDLRRFMEPARPPSPSPSQQEEEQEEHESSPHLSSSPHSSLPAVSVPMHLCFV